jgi:tight adherence protein C
VLSLRLQASGGERSLEDVVFVKVLAAAGPAACVLVLAPSFVPLAPVAACGGWLVPDLVLARAVRARMRRADAELPQFLDLLAAASSAGLAAGAAIKRAASGLRGPLAEELVRAAASVEVGGRWRVELRAIAVRLRLPDLNAAVAAIARTEILGSSLGESLRELAEDVRESRRSRVAERARTAPVKMLFPLVFMILPAFLLLTVVPVLIATLRSLK